MAADPPLSTLLSRALVAFTIELDNEFEREIVASGARPGFLTSLVMWSNFMRLLGDDGLAVRELSARAGIAKGAAHPSLAGMERWGYVVVGPDPADRRARPPRADQIVRPTRTGRKAQEVWRPLIGVVEQRWRERFGESEIDSLRASLEPLVEQLDFGAPQYLPVLGPGLLPAHFDPQPSTGAKRDPASELGLPALLSQVLLALALDFERDSELSLAMCANVVRVLDEHGVRVRDLPIRTGVSKEAVSMSMTVLDRRGYIVVEADPAQHRTKLVRLTSKGREARATYLRRSGEVEQGRRATHGPDAIDRLRTALDRLVGPDAAASLAVGLEPPPGGWRASVRRPDVLPHYPMVLHRGGWPDGS